MSRHKRRHFKQKARDDEDTRWSNRIALRFPVNIVFVLLNSGQRQLNLILIENTRGEVTKIVD